MVLRCPAIPTGSQTRCPRRGKYRAPGAGETPIARSGQTSRRLPRKRRRCASAMSLSSSGRFSFVLLTPESTYSPETVQPRCSQYSRSSRVCIDEGSDLCQGFNGKQWAGPNILEWSPRFKRESVNKYTSRLFNAHEATRCGRDSLFPREIPSWSTLRRRVSHGVRPAAGPLRPERGTKQGNGTARHSQPAQKPFAGCFCDGLRSVVSDGRRTCYAPNFLSM